MRRTPFLFAGIALVATAALSGEGNVHRSARHIPGRYIVVLESTADTAAVANTIRNLKSARVRRTYERGIKGFELESSDADARRSLATCACSSWKRMRRFPPPRRGDWIESISALSR